MGHQNKRIYLSPPHLSGNEAALLEDVLESNWIAPLGPHVDAFEQELAGYVGSPAALAVNSGTAAIHLALRLLGIGSGDIVFCSTLTFVASVSPAIHLGAHPVFIDSEPDSWNMSPAALGRVFADARCAGTMPKAVIIVNIYGQSADYHALKDICDSYGVPIIEDAAESLGATYGRRQTGTFGKFGIFSFNGNKIITTSGGGMLVSPDVDAIAQARFLASQARDPARHYQHSQLGYNYRLSNVLAAIGRGQLRVLSDRVVVKRRIFEKYRVGLGAISNVQFMPEASFGLSTRWLTVITVDPGINSKRVSKVIDALEAENIESRPVWKPLHLQPVFEGCPYYQHATGFSVSDQLFGRGLCLPSGTSLSIEEQERIIGIVADELD